MWINRPEIRRHHSPCATYAPMSAPQFIKVVLSPPKINSPKSSRDAFFSKANIDIKKRKLTVKSVKEIGMNLGKKLASNLASPLGR